MVIMTRSAYRKAGESSFEDSGKEFCNAPPWCSSGKTNERASGKRRISFAAFETRCPYSGKYFTEDREHNVRKRKRIKDNRHKQYGGWTVLVLFFILSFGTVLLVIVSRCSRKSDSHSKSLFSLVKPIESTSIDEECCFKMKQLTAALLKAEQELRRSRRQQLLISSHKVKSELAPVPYVTEGATISVGASTVEWSAQLSLWGVVPLWKTSLPPDVILSSTAPTPADCWPFSGSRGEISIHFRKAVRITFISLEHIRPDAARSAPKHFVLYGLSENGSYIKALQDEYSYHRPAKQLFSINIDLPPFKTVDFKVLSNQGNKRYTCVYRLNVYGK